MVNRHLQLLLIGFCAMAAADANAAGSRTWADALGAEISDEWRSADYRAFDFWIGEWAMNWRPPVVGQFEHQAEGSWTRQRVFPILDGKALVELAWARDAPEQPGQRGFSIRYFDPQRGRWVMAQNWPNPSNTGTAFLDQLIGNAHHGRLTMYSAARRIGADGNPVNEHRRYNFSDIRPGIGFRWDGSNTGDLGATWNTWYVVDAHRLRDLDEFRAAGSQFPGVHSEALCDTEPHGALDRLQGVWLGKVTDATGDESRARFSGGVLLDGCGVAGVLEAKSVRTFVTFGYVDRYAQWFSFSLDSRKATTHQYLAAESAGDVTVFTDAPRLTIRDEFARYNGEDFLGTADGLLRRTLDLTEAGQLSIREERRSSPEQPWSAHLTYHLKKQRDPL